MRLVSEPGQNFSIFLGARMVFVAVLLGVASLFRPEDRGALPYLLLFAANVSLSLGCWEWFRRSGSAVYVAWVALTAAVTLDTVVLYYSGGAGSVFVFLYFFSVGAAGVLTGLPGSLWTAALSTVGMICLFRAESVHWFSLHGLRALLYAVNFFLTAVVASYVFGKVRQRERSYEQTLGELRQTRLDMQAILDSLSTGVAVLNMAGEVLYSNPAGRKVLGLESSSANEAVQPLLAPDQPMGLAVRSLMQRANPDSRAEIELATATVRRPVGLSVSPLDDAEGQPRGGIVLFTDLTRLKEAERVERERERLAAIGRLSRDLAHEIRNPLATVRGCVEMIGRGEGDSAELRSYLDLALRESDRLNALLRDFLAFAQMETPRRRKADLLPLIRRRLAECPNGMSVVDELGAHHEIEFDPDQIRLAVDAIILSLCDWAENKGRIRVEQRVESPSKIRFLLDGLSIPVDATEGAFQPFSGVARTFSGLALPTALRVVHAHGGTLTLKSEAGVGTWFELTL
jgi:two-component system sensor histidine kinase PilS (NtrC family)